MVHLYSLSLVEATLSNFLKTNFLQNEFSAEIYENCDEIQNSAKESEIRNLRLEK